MLNKWYVLIGMIFSSKMSTSVQIYSHSVRFSDFVSFLNLLGYYVTCSPTSTLRTSSIILRTANKRWYLQTSTIVAASITRTPRISWCECITLEEGATKNAQSSNRMPPTCFIQAQRVKTVKWIPNLNFVTFVATEPHSLRRSKLKFHGDCLLTLLYLPWASLASANTVLVRCRRSIDTYCCRFKTKQDHC